MRVTILDLDWYYDKNSEPKLACQQLASYYKQLGSIINFPANEIELSLVYDKIYVMRDDDSFAVPRIISLVDDRVSLLGDTFLFYKQYKEHLPTFIKACRPDYLLYPKSEKEGERETAIIQMFDEDRLLKTQNYRRKTNKPIDSLIVDENFWAKDTDSLKQVYKKLRTDKNIIYKHKNRTSFFKDEEKLKMFSTLHHKYKLAPLTLICDTNAEDIIKIKDSFKANSPNNKQPTFILQASTAIENKTDFLLDYERIMSIIYQAKVNKFVVQLTAPNREETPFWAFYEDLQGWTHYHLRQSYLEFMTFFARYQNYKTEEAIYLKKWLDSRTERLKTLLVNVPVVVDNYGYQEWGDRKYYKRLDFNQLLYN